ncbi:hypothetical protein BU16DRAFT_526926 [Lophium mytilinum]|uniref:Uncharacterized protein n=1 Tax=Lophium mytilinum TaxID=390894 RepID=A0A6A6QWA9_9PEZI|nr:hypothetical protein BU16DRAFT_526926 [Lophium mytilinum]
MPLPKWSQSLRSDDSRISFLDLALELREQIYEAMLVVPVIYPPTDEYPWAPKPNLNILAVCRQTRAEASKVFATRNIFTTGGKLIGCAGKDRFEAVVENLGYISETVQARWVENVAFLKFVVDFRWVAPSAKLTRPWIGKTGTFIQETFPAIKKVTFILYCPNQAWFYALAPKKTGGDFYDDLSSDDYSDLSNEDLVGDPHWPQFSSQYNGSENSSSDNTEDLNSYMVGMGRLLFDDAEAPCDLTDSDSEEDSGSGSEEDSSSASEEDSSSDSEEGSISDPEVSKPASSSVEDTTLIGKEWDNSTSGLGENVWESDRSSSTSSSSSSSESSSESDSDSDAAAINLLAYQMLTSGLGTAFSDLDSDSDSEELEMPVIYGDDDLDFADIPVPKELDDDAKAVIHEEILKHWKTELGFDMGIPTWAEFEFVPRYINEGRHRAPRIVVDMAEIWKEVKADRDAAGK